MIIRFEMRTLYNHFKFTSPWFVVDKYYCYLLFVINTAGYLLVVLVVVVTYNEYVIYNM